MHELEKLADLIRKRNDIETEITQVIGRPAQIGHLGEYIASMIFDIALEASAVNKGYDGTFRTGLLAGKTVDVKWYAKREGLLDLREQDIPDYYLVLAGPASPAGTSGGQTRPWYIDEVFVFPGKDIVQRLLGRGKGVGTATSLTRDYWNEARIYPTQTSRDLIIDNRQREKIALFSSRK